jgi:hypothetical protein
MLRKSDVTRQKIKTEVVGRFKFGDPDAKSDDVLLHCPLSIKGVKEFLQLSGSKNIVLGERGAGKSALFKLIVEEKFKFEFDLRDKEKPKKVLIVPIDDDLEYLTIANVVEERFIDKEKKPHGKYRYLWEIYVLSRVIDRLQEAGENDKELEALRDDFGCLLGAEVKAKFRMSDLLTAYKLTLGGKFDQAGTVTPTFSVEPAKDALAKRKYIADHEIGVIKDRLRKYIKARNLVAIVLIDKIDDFVVGIDYEEQRKNMQALLECTQNFRYPELKLKIFMRADLFKRLDFERSGYDKMSTQVVRLEWSRDDICEFVARRLLYNYKVLQITPPRSDVNLEFLDLDPSLREKIIELLRVRVTGIGSLFKLLGSAAMAVTQAKWSRFFRNSHTARKTDLLQELCLKLITYVLPARVTHYNVYCKKEELSIEDFLATHFRLGGDSPNPRLVLLFLNFVFEETSHYYSRNPDTNEIEANYVNEYELILKDHVLSGYQTLQSTARTTIAQLNTEWRPFVERLYANLGHPKTCIGLSVEKIKKYTDWKSTDEELTRFLAFFTHVGLFISDNPTAVFSKRTFTLPTVLKSCQ